MNKTIAILRNMTDEQIAAEEEEYARLIEREIELEQELREKLPDELKECFEEYVLVQIEMRIADGEDEYAQGFERGLLLLADTLRDRKE